MKLAGMREGFQPFSGLGPEGFGCSAGEGCASGTLGFLVPSELFFAMPYSPQSFMVWRMRSARRRMSLGSMPSSLAFFAISGGSSGLLSPNRLVTK